MNSRRKEIVQIGSGSQLLCKQWDASKIKTLGASCSPVMRLVIFSVLACLIACALKTDQVQANVLIRVCDSREIKTVTSRVCMLYKRTNNSNLKLDRYGNLRISRSTGSHSKGEYSPAKLASDCCKIGCPPHIFALNC